MQEESSWPMSEGILLKKKFDDVFESTRYTKVMVQYSVIVIVVMIIIPMMISINFVAVFAL